MATPVVDSQTLFLLDPPDLGHWSFADEDTLIRQWMDAPVSRIPAAPDIRERARPLLDAMRHPGAGLRIETLLQEYALDTREGITLMCLAEALLRIPDEATAEQFLEDRLRQGDWSRHVGHSESLWVNASTWGLVLAGKVCHPHGGDHWSDTLMRWLGRLGEPLALTAIRHAMTLIGQQFVAGETISEALSEARAYRNAGYRYSFDMLGEAALTAADVSRYTAAYEGALEALIQRSPDERSGVSLSVKLSAFHPRFEPRKPEAIDAVIHALTPLLHRACAHDIAITLDAEESWRLECSLEVFRQLKSRAPFRQWNGLGLAVQAYQKRALAVLHWLGDVSRLTGSVIPVRLVKGAYWDSEIKWAQQHGLKDYPVFTRKAATDLHYQICAHYLMTGDHGLSPQFATHNAITFATVLALADANPHRRFEFQRLHGMGESLHDWAMQHLPGVHSRIYAPVGPFRELLPYLVRRLLENGANTSFIRQSGEHDIETLLRCPRDRLLGLQSLRHPAIPVPGALFQDRRNSPGIAIEDHHERRRLMASLSPWLSHRWHLGDGILVSEPAAHHRIVGEAPHHGADAIAHALQCASDAWPTWRTRSVIERAALADAVADQLELYRDELLALLIREAGKTLPNAVSEWREAIDFCRYYAQTARTRLMPQPLPGPTGETNTLILEGRGVLVCISPWNFPLAIFIGQIIASLVSGNAVIAKPSLQTPLIALRATALVHAAGVPDALLRCLCVTGRDTETHLLSAPGIAGVLFTGSHAVAQGIARRLAARPGAFLPLIAETGGMNAMIVDSTALPEQAIRDIAISAFDSAGQRCSALRIVYLQEDIADSIIHGLRGHLAQLRIGDPTDPGTDIGPVINDDARDGLRAHIENFRIRDAVVFETGLSSSCLHGSFIGPTILSLDDPSWLTEEQFGPLLHVVRFRADERESVLNRISTSGYGLTFGIHTRIESFWREAASRLPVGNVYINRSMIGATVGVHPFGGQGLSGTGPKAGGPHYLLRLVHEKTVTENRSATGGDAELVAKLNDL